MTAESKKTAGVLLLTAAAAYVVWRIQEAHGGPIVWVNPLQLLLPGNPSMIATAGTGITNAASPAFLLPSSRAYKLPGNLSSMRALPAARGTAADPLAPPGELTYTAQPERPMFVGEEVRYLPNLGDPNMSLYDYLATTPPDLAWGIDERPYI